MDRQDEGKTPGGRPRMTVGEIVGFAAALIGTLSMLITTIVFWSCYQLNFSCTAETVGYAFNVRHYTRDNGDGTSRERTSGTIVFSADNPASDKIMEAVKALEDAKKQARAAGNELPAAKTPMAQSSAYTVHFDRSGTFEPDTAWVVRYNPDKPEQNYAVGLNDPPDTALMLLILFGFLMMAGGLALIIRKLRKRGIFRGRLLKDRLNY